MAKNIDGDVFNIPSTDIKDTSPKLHRVLLTNFDQRNPNFEVSGGALATQVRDIKSILEAMKSGVNPDSYFSSRQIMIDPKSGKSITEIFVQAEEMANALKGGQYRIGNLSNPNAYFQFSDSVVAGYDTGKIRLHGSEAKSIALKELQRVGGRLKELDRDTDTFAYFIPTAEDGLEADLNFSLKEAREASYKEQRKRNRLNKQKTQAEELKRIAEQKKAEDKARADADKLIEKAEKEAESESEKKKREALINQRKLMAEMTSDGKLYASNVWKDFENEEKNKEIAQAEELKRIAEQKKAEDKARADAGKLIEKAEKEAKKEEDKQKREEQKEQKESQRTIKGAITKVLATLTILADITRRILSSVMAGASQAVADTRLAGDYGLRYKDIRNYRVQEKALGINDGSIIGAIQALQEKFGNITSLDEKSIEQLAIVMGGEVKELIQSGIGGSNPDVLLSKILDKYFSTAMSGYNSIGQYVGQEQARRELVSQLSRVSPQLSELLSVMLENAQNPNSLYYGKYNTFNGMLDTIPTNRAGLQSYQDGTFYVFGDYVNKLKSAVEDMKKAVETIIAGKLVRVLEGLSQNTAFMSDQEKLKEFTRRREANEKSKIDIEEKLAEINSSDDATQALSDLGVDTTITDVARSALGKKGGTLNRKEAQKILRSLAGNKNTGGELLTVLGYLATIDLIDKQLDLPLEKGQTEIAVKDPLIVSSGVESLKKILLQGRSWDNLSKEEQALLLEGVDFIRSNTVYGEQVTKDILLNSAVSSSRFSVRSGLADLKSDLAYIQKKGSLSGEHWYDPNKYYDRYASKAGYGTDPELGRIVFNYSGQKAEYKENAFKVITAYLEEEIAKLEKEQLARALLEVVDAPTVVSGTYVGSTHSDSAELMFNAFKEALVNNYASEASEILVNGVNSNGKLTVEVKAEEGTSAKTTGSGDVTKVTNDTWQMENAQAQ